MYLMFLSFLVSMVLVSILSLRFLPWHDFAISCEFFYIMKLGHEDLDMVFVSWSTSHPNFSFISPNISAPGCEVSEIIFNASFGSCLVHVPKLMRLGDSFGDGIFSVVRTNSLIVKLRRCILLHHFDHPQDPPFYNQT